jgi:hypothetical protein
LSHPKSANFPKKSLVRPDPLDQHILLKSTLGVRELTWQWCFVKGAVVARGVCDGQTESLKPGNPSNLIRVAPA